IGEFLAEWTRIHRPGMELIRVVGDDQSTRSREIRELLNRNGIPFGFHQTGSISANRLIEQRGAEIKAMPALFLHDGTILFDPTDAEIMDAVGESPGPAGLTAAVYAGSEGLRTLVIERHVSGVVVSCPTIERAPIDGLKRRIGELQRFRQGLRHIRGNGAKQRMAARQEGGKGERRS